ncbi:hypothetical protein Acy02nite_91220 [Actinoplanes cyaneus]|uniref:Uncharacterized protein n=1 Tax=Actinoplanes cyaneus TaxID=52696 RepID=A0A919MHG0_9ACTN|nr:hypothetical protein Acy02nite_91220 [Actinoplanes cyaneus]
MRLSNSGNSAVGQAHSSPEGSEHDTVCRGSTGHHSGVLDNGQRLHSADGLRTARETRVCYRPPIASRQETRCPIPGWDLTGHANPAQSRRPTAAVIRLAATLPAEGT